MCEVRQPRAINVVQIVRRLVDRLHPEEAAGSSKSAVPLQHSLSVLGLKETALDGAQNAASLRIVKLMKQDDHYLVGWTNCHEL